MWLRAELWARGRPHARNLAALPTLSRVLDGSSALMRDPPGRTYISLMLAGGSGGTRVFARHCLTAHATNPHASPLTPHPNLSLTNRHTQVAPHAGPTNHRLRLHLPLLLPGEDGGGGGASDAVAITAPSCAPAPPATSARTTRGAGAVRVYDMPRDAGYIAYTAQYTGMSYDNRPSWDRAGACTRLLDCAMPVLDNQ